MSTQAMIVAFHEDALAEFRAAAIRYARRNPALASSNQSKIAPLGWPHVAK
jgi:hypothetical protein